MAGTHPIVRWLVFAICVAWTSIASTQEVSRAAPETPRTRVFKIPRTVRPSIQHSDHPLVPALRIARQHHAYILENVHSYTCTLVKRERIDGELHPHEHITVKFRDEQRHQGNVVVPFSVYMNYLAPASLRGREILYVQGENDGDTLVRKGGRRNSYLNIWVDPLGDLAMRGNRYPITEFGIENLVKRLIEVAEEDMKHAECEAFLYKAAKVDGRICTAIEVRHPVQREHFRFHVARVFIDDQLHVPIRYAAYSWPTAKGQNPPLVEEYTFRDLKLNVTLSPADFDRLNPEYGFRKK